MHPARRRGMLGILQSVAGRVSSYSRAVRGTLRSATIEPGQNEMLIRKLPIPWSVDAKFLDRDRVRIRWNAPSHHEVGALPCIAGFGVVRGRSSINAPRVPKLPQYLPPARAGFATGCIASQYFASLDRRDVLRNVAGMSRKSFFHPNKVHW
jgi:hypothetical protein